MALCLGIAVLVLNQPAFAQNRCESIFRDAELVSKLDMNSNVRAYYWLTHKYGKKTPDKVEVTLPDGSVVKIKASEELKLKMDPTKNLDIATMGYLGKIFDLKYDPVLKKTLPKINDHYYREELTSAREHQMKMPSEPSAEFSDFITKLLGVEKIEGGFVTLRMDLLQRPNEPLPYLERQIKARFLMTYIQLVNWSYRTSGLEKNKSLSNLNMMDEMAEIGVREKKSIVFNLIYDQNVWNQQLRALESRVKEYHSAESRTDKEQTEIAQKIAAPSDPYFPLAGVATTYDIISPSKPMEIKRYFKNDHQDPLGLMELRGVNEFIVRHKMIYKMISDLPPGQELEIHAHTAVHARAYLKLGFHRAGTIHNPKYPDIEVQLLKAHREEVLKKIAAILSEQK